MAQKTIVKIMVICVQSFLPSSVFESDVTRLHRAQCKQENDPPPTENRVVQNPIAACLMKITGRTSFELVRNLGHPKMLKSGIFELFQV